MTNRPDSASDIEKIASTILKESGALDVFPTPIQCIVDYSELIIDKKHNLSMIDKNFFSKWGDSAHKLLRSALEKVLGAIDIREKTIYLDLNQIETKKSFVKLHEVGHGILPWQKKTYSFLDDKYTLRADTTVEFDREANFFASATLFQLDRFNNLAKRLPLKLASAMHLAKHFGASNHATLRRYVEASTKRCALLVLETEESNKILIPKIRDYFQSESFSKEFDFVEWNNANFHSLPFIDLYNFKVKLKDEQELIYSHHGKKVCFEYDYFNNSYNAFVFLRPKGERIKSRVTFKVA